MITAMHYRIGIRWKIAAVILSILILSPGRPREAHEMRKRLGRVSQNGDYAAATSLAHRLVECTEKTFGNDSPEVAGALNSLGTLYRATAD